MTDQILHWLRTASWLEAAAVFILENLLILAGVVLIGNWMIARFSSRRVSPEPEPLTRGEIWIAVMNVTLNSAITLAGLALWRAGLVTFRTDVGIMAVVDIVVLLLGMDLAMYLLHRIAHLRFLFPLLHRYHHVFEHPRPLTLFALNPLENLAFGSLWLVAVMIYDASWLGMSIYLGLNVIFGMIGHLGVEPLPIRWARRPLVRHLAGGTFHAQHHVDPHHNFGFYTLIWDRLFGTLRPDYERNFGRLPELAEGGA